ncbi:MAG TPA: ABC transporter ATP-binding protein, partial [Gemmatimonadaceae bacterium]|nr:ABC transporter ATP-binding protein [Gemmatimonadaceae bacterium]
MDASRGARASEPPAGTGGDAAAPDRKGFLGFNEKRRGYVRAYLGWLRPHRAQLASLIVLALAVAGMEMIEPLFMRTIIDKVLLNRAIDAATRISRLNLIGGGFLAFIVFSKLVGVLKDYRQRLLNVRVILSLRRALYDRMLHLPLPQLWEMKTGGILSRLSGDVETTTGFMQMAIISPALSAVRLVIALGILMAINWRLALTAMAVMPGIMYISFTASKRVRPIYRAMRKDVELIDGRVGEAFSGIRVVRAFGGEIRELLDYMVGRHTVLRKELFAHRRELWLWTSWGLLIAMVNVVIVWYGGSLNLAGRASIGDIMAFQWYTFLITGPIWNIVNSFSELQRSLAAMERVFEVMAMPDDKPDRPGAVDAPATVREIRLEGVEFEYREGRPVLRDFSVTVPGGSVVALVGRSGAGKTTVTDLIARFHDPTRGRLLVNGTDIRDFTLRTYRGLLAIVQQDTFLFDGSVTDNIAYGRHQASFAEVVDAARRANAAEFIERLPGGYETWVGERGVKLSGGQQQRLAIARAILADPQILILDEATSNLDTESEQLIQAAMSSLLAGRTTFVIAHRLSTVRRADLILVMEDGRIVERGTHEALMAARGAYHEMVVRQAEAQADSAEPVLR